VPENITHIIRFAFPDSRCSSHAAWLPSERYYGKISAWGVPWLTRCLSSGRDRETQKMRGHGGENPHAKPCMAWATDPARIEREDRWTGHRPLGGKEETGDERKAAREATDASRELLLSSAAIRARWILQPFHSPVTTDHQTGFSWNSMAGRGRRRHPGRFLLLDHETSLSDPSLYDDRSIDAI
jgi:hypothetical protein